MSRENIAQRVLRLLSTSNTKDTQIQPGVELPSGLVVPHADSMNSLAQLPTEKTSKDLYEILVPNAAEVQNLANKEESLLEYRNAILSFKSSSWGYVEQKILAQNIPSPVKEMREQITTFRKKSKNKKNTQSAREASSGISDDSKLPDSSIVNLLNLKFIKNIVTDENEKNVVLYELSTALGKSIRELSSPLGFMSENQMDQEGIIRFFQRFDLVVLAYLYKTGRNKISDPQLLDLVTEKLLFLVDRTAVKLPSKEIVNLCYSLFDFLSYFEMENSELCTFVLRLSKQYDLSHPLQYAAEYFLQQSGHHEEFLKEYGYDSQVEKMYGDTISHKVGLEIEGVPLCIHGDFPTHFTPGVDGGETMPEVRRDDDALVFNAEYRKELFDWWYFAKVTQFKGASLHVHLDDPLQLLREVFIEIGNGDDKSVSVSYHNTIELRFNLASYDDYDDTLNFSVPTIADQYHIVPLIEYLLQSGHAGYWLPIPKNIPKHWQAALDKIQNPVVKPVFTFDLAMNIAIQNTELRTSFKKFRRDDETKEFVKSLPRVFTPEQVMTLARETNYFYTVVNTCLKRMNGKLTVDQFLELLTFSIGERHSVLFYMIGRIVTPVSTEDLGKIASFFDGDIKKIKQIVTGKSIHTYEDLKTAMNNDLLNTTELFTLLNTYGGKFSYEEVLELFTDHNQFSTYYGAYILEKLNSTLTEVQLFTLLESVDYTDEVILAGLEALGTTLTQEQAEKIIDTTYNNHEVITAVFKKMDGPVSFDFFMNLINTNELSRVVGDGTLHKLESLSEEQYQTLKQLISQNSNPKQRMLTYFPQLMMVPSNKRPPAILLKEFMSDEAEVNT